jgi:hypothetical protein
MQPMLSHILKGYDHARGVYDHRRNHCGFSMLEAAWEACVCGLATALTGEYHN